MSYMRRLSMVCRSFEAAAAKYKRMHGLEHKLTETEDRLEHLFVSQCSERLRCNIDGSGPLQPGPGKWSKVGESDM